MPDTLDLKTLTQAFETKNARVKEIANSIEGKGTPDEPFALKEEMVTEFRKTVAERDELKTLIEVATAGDEGDRFLGGLKGAPADLSAALLAAIGGAKDLPESKSLGEAFVKSEEFREMMERGEFSMRRPFGVKGDLGSMHLGRKDVYSDLPSGTPGSFGRVDRDPMVPRPQRTRRVRDLFPVQRTTAAVIEYFRVTGFTNAASVVPERDGSAFGAKPQSSLEFTGEQASVRTIAHWEAAHRNALSDEPQLQGLIENELLYGLRLVEDDQILNGTGTGQDLLGIRNVTGVQDYAWSTGEAGPPADNKADAVRRAMTLVLLAYYEPTGVVLHDSNWEDMELLKDSNGQYLLAVSIAVGGEQRIWRAPVVTTPAMTAGKALVGAFGIGAQLYDREEGNIRIAEQHSDFFVRNAVVVLAEERLALATKRPEAFVEVDFDAAPA